MHEARPKHKAESPARQRARRSDEALIARYILELSGRHARFEGAPSGGGRNDAELVQA
jgi:hypothetical protein